jgi:hypothetical protein
MQCDKLLRLSDIKWPNDIIDRLQAYTKDAKKK